MVCVRQRLCWFQRSAARCRSVSFAMRALVIIKWSPFLSAWNVLPSRAPGAVLLSSERGDVARTPRSSAARTFDPPPTRFGSRRGSSKSPRPGLRDTPPQAPSFRRPLAAPPATCRMSAWNCIRWLFTHVAAVRHSRRKPLDLCRGLDDPEAVAQPLHHRTADEDAALQCEIRAPAATPRW